MKKKEQEKQNEVTSAKEVIEDTSRSLNGKEHASNIFDIPINHAEYAQYEFGDVYALEDDDSSEDEMIYRKRPRVDSSSVQNKLSLLHKDSATALKAGGKARNGQQQYLEQMKEFQQTSINDIKEILSVTKKLIEDDRESRKKEHEEMKTVLEATLRDQQFFYIQMVYFMRDVKETFKLGGGNTTISPNSKDDPIYTHLKTGPHTDQPPSSSDPKNLNFTKVLFNVDLLFRLNIAYKLCSIYH